MKAIIISLFLWCAFSLHAQTWKQTKTGLRYKVIRDVKGKPAVYNDEVSIHYQFLNFKDSLLTTSEGRDPITFKLEPTFKGSLEEGLTKMSEGDSMHFEIPSDSLGFPQRPPFIPEGSKVVFRVKMISIARAPAAPKAPKKKKTTHKKFKKLPSGVEYLIIQDKTGQVVQRGGMVSLDLNYTNEKENFKGLEQNQGEPIQLLIPDTMPPHNFLEALIGLNKGDSVLVKMSSDTLYKRVFNQPIPEGLPAGSKTTFEIKILDVLSRDSVEILRAQYLAEKAREKQVRVERFSSDTSFIAEYLKRNNMIAQKSPEGVFCVIKSVKAGPLLQSGDTASTYYAGRLLEGPQFDANFNAEENQYGRPFDVIVGVSPVIPGWHFALMMLRKGEKATIYIPSILGYGEEGAGQDIPPNSILVFDIEIKE